MLTPSLLLLAILALVGAQPRMVSAHASLIGTDPADGEVLESTPERLTLSFSEPVEPVEEGYRLFDDEGQIGTLTAEVSRSDVLLPLPDDLDDGSYALSWRVISLDGHPIQGTLLFSIGEADTGPLTVSESADITPIVSVVQGIAYAGLLAAVGLMLFRLLVTGDPRVDRMPALVATTIAVIGHVLLIPLTALRAAGRPLADLLTADAWSGGTDSVTVTVTLIVAVALAGAWATTFARSATPRFAGVLAGVFGALMTLPMIGHTRTGEFSAVLSGIDVVHGLAAAVWFGGLIGLARFLRREGQRDAPAAARVVSRFSTLAGVVVTLAAASGVYLSYRYLDDLGALLDTTYGRLLIAKVAVLLVPLGLAAWNRLSLVPAVERQPDRTSAWRLLRAVVIAEVVLLVAAIGLTGFLVLQSPQGEPAAAEPVTSATPFAQTVALEEGGLEIVIMPGGRGENTMTLTVHDDAGAPVELAGDVVVELSLPAQELGPLEATLAPTETPGDYAGVITVPLEGEWEVTMILRVTRFEQVTETVIVPFTGAAE